ncbi:hypothetical protein VTK73DRAFT_3628 [Phialemonium thermophilum]|uniref:Transmembrane protein n=1 Tax=Phialemonium thermophilum TaxID=223376 RepID=A0ABR3WXX4_9PEZI
MSAPSTLAIENIEPAYTTLPYLPSYQGNRPFVYNSSGPPLPITAPDVSELDVHQPSSGLPWSQGSSKVTFRTSVCETSSTVVSGFVVSVASVASLAFLAIVFETVVCDVSSALVSGAVAFLTLASLSSFSSSLYSKYYSFICAFVPLAVSCALMYANFDAMSCAEGMAAER